jgi:hypothetical protein
MNVDRLPQVLVALVVAALAVGQSASWAQTPVTVPPGYSIKVVASGLNGPEGLDLWGAGHIAICEAIDVASEPGLPASHLTLVQRKGRAETVASDNGEAGVWVDVAIDPQRGYFVSTLGGAARGIKLVTFDGQVSQFSSPLVHFGGIALDSLTGDLYAAHISYGATSIDRIAPDGTRSVFKAGVRPEGMAITAGRVLIATIQFVDNVPVNQVVAFDLNTGTETVLAVNVGTRIGAVAVSKRGDILITDEKDGRIRRLSPDDSGAYIVSEFASGFSTTSARYPADLRPEFGLSFNNLAFDPAGRLYVTDYGAGKLYLIEGRF